MRKMPWGIKKLLNFFEILIKLIKQYFVFIRYELHSRHSRDRLDEAHYEFLDAALTWFGDPDPRTPAQKTFDAIQRGVPILWPLPRTAAISPGTDFLEAIRLSVFIGDR
jgi:hypothetical protein